MTTMIDPDQTPDQPDWFDYGYPDPQDEDKEFLKDTEWYKDLDKAMESGEPPF